MLGDAAGLAGDDVGLAHRVEQRGLAVVDMAHDGDDRRARLQIAPRRRRRPRRPSTRRRTRRRACTRWPNSVATSSAVSASITSLIVAIMPVLHQDLDDVDAALGHAVGELLHGDRLGNDDLARTRGPREPAAGVARARLAPERGDRAHALFVVRQRAVMVSLPGRRPPRCGLARRRRLGGRLAAVLARLLFFLVDRGALRRRGGQRPARLGRVLGAPSSFGAARGFLLGAAARPRSSAACALPLRPCAFRRLRARGACARLRRRGARASSSARLRASSSANCGVGQRAQPRGLLVFGQLAQDHAAAAWLASRARPRRAGGSCAAGRFGSAAAGWRAACGRASAAGA